ncbi:hypothetical protein CIRMBP1320_01024 [Enterococcus cecorum]|nr:hypothetical protein CIRMBP1320_01024 [Enterococcus cecorum]
MKIQIYPSSELANALICAAQSKDLSLNALILEVLENKFLEKENMPVSELTNIVFKEVTSYVEQNTDKEFDLFVASETFRNIPMTADGKPSPLRAQIGRSFANSVRSGRFELPIQKVKLENGKNKLSLNNALVYKLMIKNEPLNSPLPLYEPIYEKIRSWIGYFENQPKIKYNENPEAHDQYRQQNDLDCVLRNGNLNADTIFSLWLPLRYTLVSLNGYVKIEHTTGLKIEKTIPFLKSLISNNNLEKLLPKEKQTTVLLSNLFKLGQRIENTMLLPVRALQKRGGKPYFDYMPYFLYECFEGGDFFGYFGADKKFIQWVIDEDLDMFFNGNISKENIIDLANTGDLKKGIPTEINDLLVNYIKILEQRRNRFVE